MSIFSHLVFINRPHSKTLPTVATLCIFILTMQLSSFANQKSSSTNPKSILTGMISIGDEEELPNEINSYEKLLNKKMGSVVRYMDWETTFPTKACKTITEHGSIPCLVWMPHWPSKTSDARRSCPPDETGLDDILKGVHDDYIEAFALHSKSFSHPIFLKFLYEFNANWYTWSGLKNGGADGGSEEVIAVWKYVVSKFREVGADNVKWVWCPHEPSEHVSLEDWNAIPNYWPGEEWVDWLGIDGFNFYPKNPERENPTYLSFDDCFEVTYKQLRALSDKPIQIMTGSAEFVHGSEKQGKKDWVENMFAQLNTYYEGIEALYWFHYRFDEVANWRVDSSPEVLEVFRCEYAKPIFNSN